MPLPWKRLLVVAPHPDDESLATGGLIRRAVVNGASVRVVLATDGEFNHWPQRYVEGRWRIRPADRERWGARRRKEAIAALAMLGVTQAQIDFLGLPDNRLGGLGVTELRRHLAPIIEEFVPDLVVSPSNCDLHPDHRLLATTVERILDELPPPHFQVLTYVTHGCADASRLIVELQLTDEEKDSKLGAILCHETQLALSRARLLRFANESEVFYQPGDRAPRLAHLKRLWEICFPGPFPSRRRASSAVGGSPRVPHDSSQPAVVDSRQLGNR